MIKKRTKPRFARITTRVIVEKVVKVKAYIRFRNGKPEKVESHYRKY